MRTVISFSIISILIVTFFSCSIQSTKSLSKSISLEQLVRQAPKDIFEYTTEGITEGEKAVLLEKGASINWLIKERTDNQYSIESKVPYSKLRLFRKITSRQQSVLVVFTENEKVQHIETWHLTGSQIKKAKLVPSIATNDFFNNAQSKNIGNKYPNNIAYTLEDNHTFKASITDWMNNELGALSPYYDIKLVWDGDKFEIKKRPIK